MGGETRWGCWVGGVMGGKGNGWVWLGKVNLLWGIFVSSSFIALCLILVVSWTL